VKSPREIMEVASELLDKLRDGSIDVKMSNKITKLIGKLLKLDAALLKAEKQGDLEKITQIRADGDLLSNQLDQVISESKTT